jgi:hypothetical protein
MPYVKPGEIAKAQEFIDNVTGGSGKPDVDAELADFLERHPISGEKGDTSPYTKVDGVYVSKASVEAADWTDPVNVRFDE